MYFEKVRDALAQQFELDPETITPETNLLDDLGADSLDVVELIMSLEDEFGIKLTGDVIKGFETVGDIIALMNK